MRPPDLDRPGYRKLPQVDLGTAGIPEEDWLALLD
jgi:hypothetical protein